MKLSKLERITLIHQHRIIQRLYPDEATDSEKAIDILSNGYEYFYDELYQYVYDGEDAMSEDECKCRYVRSLGTLPVNSLIWDGGSIHDERRTRYSTQT